MPYEECFGFGGYLIDVDTKTIKNKHTMQVKNKSLVWWRNDVDASDYPVHIGRNKRYCRTVNLTYLYSEIERTHLERKSANCFNQPDVVCKRPSSTSRPCQEWMKYLSVSIPNLVYLHDEQGEYTLPESGYMVDGFDKDKNVIYEFNGDFWHGNPSKYDKDKINAVTKKTFGVMYENTLRKERVCKAHGYGYVSIWESDWKRGCCAIRQLQKYYRTFWTP
jgi:hypothetical protein